MAAAVDTNSIPKELREPAITWGNDTNDLCAGLFVSQNNNPAPPIQTIDVFVLTSKTNAMWNYVEAPGNKFAKLELRDTNGVVIPPLKGKKLDDDLPQKIVEEDLPTTPASIHLRRAWLMLPPSVPEPLKDFNIQDVYRITNAGDYTLKICVAIYQFAPDRKSVLRIDLPCVTTKIHLTPSK